MGEWGVGDVACREEWSTGEVECRGEWVEGRWSVGESVV